jgi:superfamily II DNA or RNA helicase
MRPLQPSLIVTNEARLCNASAQLCAKLKQRLTIDNPRYQAARKYGKWIGKRLPPVLHFYSEEEGCLSFPRGLARDVVLSFRKTKGIGLRIIDRRSMLPERSFHFQGKLRDYQIQAVDNLCRHEFGVLEAGTGSGKTVIALAVIARRKQPTVIFVHTKELLYQWRDRINEFLDIEAGLIGDGRFELQDVTVAIVNSARKKLADLTGRFGHLVVDECHRVPASLFTEVVTAFDCRYSLGLSATAFRSDGLTNLIYYFLGTYRHQVDQLQLLQSGAVLKPKFIQRPTTFHYGYRGNYQKLIKALTLNAERNALIVADIAREAKNGKGTLLVVSDRVAHCQLLHGALLEGGIAPVLLIGSLPQEKRTQLVQEIREGKHQIVLATIQLIGEGFDCPGLETLFLTTPLKFSGRILQVVGRILRPVSGKKPKVFDYLDPVGVLMRSARQRLRLFGEEASVIEENDLHSSGNGSKAG